MELQHTDTDITVRGISTRTNNATEMSENGKIPQLWADLYNAVDVNYMAGNRVFGVYDNYESDANGDFDVFAGTNQAEVNSTIALSSKIIPKGKYLVFTEVGTMPQIAIEAWTKVWNYFNSDSCSHTRRYQVDYEYYANGNEIRVHIGVV
jgi:predicted transcriptional regulator YdeE